MPSASTSTPLTAVASAAPSAGGQPASTSPNQAVTPASASTGAGGASNGTATNSPGTPGMGGSGQMPPGMQPPGMSSGPAVPGRLEWAGPVRCRLECSHSGMSSGLAGPGRSGMGGSGQMPPWNAATWNVERSWRSRDALEWAGPVKCRQECSHLECRAVLAVRDAWNGRARSNAAWNAAAWNVERSWRSRDAGNGRARSNAAWNAAAWNVERSWRFRDAWNGRVGQMPLWNAAAWCIQWCQWPRNAWWSQWCRYARRTGHVGWQWSLFRQQGRRGRRRRSKILRQADGG